MSGGTGRPICFLATSPFVENGFAVVVTQSQDKIRKETSMMADFPHVELSGIDNLSIALKKGTVKVSFEVLPGPEILRLIYLSTKAARPMNVVIESPQAEMDLKICEVEIKTGEVK